MKRKKKKLYKKEKENYVDPFDPEEISGDLRSLTKEYISDFEKAVKYQDEVVDRPIEVDQLASKVAKLYEKFRQVVDWKEEHIIRRSSIERILKRSFISRVSGKNFILKIDVKNKAEDFLREVVLTGNFQQKNISKSKIHDVQAILDKYIFILENNPLSNTARPKIKRKVEFYNWLMSIAACEIEECLDDPLEQKAILNFMTQTLYTRIKVTPKNELTQEEIFLQTFIASKRALYNLEGALVSYHILLRKYPDFIDYENHNLVWYGENIVDIWEEIENDLNHENRGKFFALCKHYSAAYLIIADVANKVRLREKDLEKVIKNPKEFYKYIEDAYYERLKTLKKRLNRSAVYSTLSILIAGAASLIILEFPVAKWLYGEYKPWAMFVDLMVPTLLMFILVSMIRPPGRENITKLKTEVQRALYENGKDIIYEIEINKKRGKASIIFFTIIYILGGYASIYLTFQVFLQAGVPWTSLYIDVANVAIVVFAAMVIRHKSKELTIEEEGSFANLLVGFFSIPLAKVGMWFSRKWREYNFISVFLTAFVDMPFSVFVSLLADWRKFIKQKSSEIHG